jgi:hypothetical protein
LVCALSYPFVINNKAKEKMRALKKSIVTSVSVALIGCGGGSGSSSTGSGQTNNSNPSINPIFTAFVPSSATLASKKTNSSLVFSSQGSGNPSNQGCTTTLSNKTVYEQANTVVFAADGVSENDQQEVAEYAESAVQEVRAKFPTSVSTSTGVFENKKVYVCVQPQPVGTGSVLGQATPWSASAYSGIIIMEAANNYFVGGKARNSLLTGGEAFQQDYYRRSLTHETTHLVSNFNLSSALDLWFEEGFARWMEFGKPAITKEAVLAQIAAQNPITVSTSLSLPGAIPLKDYNTAAAVISYLLSPTGANNTIATVSAFWAKNKIDGAKLADACRATPVGADCVDVSTYESKRAALFVATFEATFKEKDGSLMKLRSGANNLQDTLSARISAFW